MMSSEQLCDGFGELVKSESVLLEVCVRGECSRQRIRSFVAYEHEEYLREAVAHYAKKLKSIHTGHVEVGDD